MELFHNSQAMNILNIPHKVTKYFEIFHSFMLTKSSFTIIQSNSKSAGSYDFIYFICFLGAESEVRKRNFVKKHWKNVEFWRIYFFGFFVYNFKSINFLWAISLKMKVQNNFLQKCVTRVFLWWIVQTKSASWT